MKEIIGKMLSQCFLLPREQYTVVIQLAWKENKNDFSVLCVEKQIFFQNPHSQLLNKQKQKTTVVWNLIESANALARYFSGHKEDA